MRITEKEHKKIKKMFDLKTTKTINKESVKKTEGNVPIWFNKQLESTEATDEEMEEMDKMIAAM